MAETCFNSGFLAFVDPFHGNRPVLILDLFVFRVLWPF